MTPRALPAGPLIAFYGDDFTGSAAVMEVLTFAGLDTVLFLAAPTAEQLAAFDGYRGVGIAGTARSQTPAWMERELPPVYEALARLGAPVIQYKICSTLDSSPVLGSIGKAAEIGMAVFGGGWHPILPAAPAIGRYQAFGHFFALAEGTPYRLDRHPTMSRHPATPIDESDVRLHLGRQTTEPVGLIDLLALKSGEGACRLREEAKRARLIALDVIDEETLSQAGRLIWEEGGDRIFALASQGLEHALLAYWQEAGLLEPAGAPPRANPVEQIVAVSGSCSSVTAGQIDWAAAHGFDRVAVDATGAVDARAWEAELSRASDEGLRVLSSGRSPILHTASGPDDPAVARFRTAVEASPADPAVVNARIGHGLGTAVQRLLATGGVRRAAIAGGDTSSHATLALDVHALTACALVCTGGSLLQVHSDGPAMRGVEVALKGGQMGPRDYFSRVRQGG
jgi:uncharacterized protein YgbK (DUF1537 family)